MKLRTILRTIAANTFGIFCRQIADYFCRLVWVRDLMMMSPLLAVRARPTASNLEECKATAGLVSAIMYMVSGAGSLLAAWAAADAVATGDEKWNDSGGGGAAGEAVGIFAGEISGRADAHGVLRGDDVRIELPAGRGWEEGDGGFLMLLAYPSCGTRFMRR